MLLRDRTSSKSNTRLHAESTLRPRKNRLVRAVAMACLSTSLLLLSQEARAIDTFWNAATGDWFDGANWNTLNIPTGADNTFIDNGGTAQVAVPGAVAADLRIGSTATGFLVITNGGTVSSSTGGIGDDASGSGDVTVTGTGSTWTNSNTLFIGGFGTGAKSIAGRAAARNSSWITGWAW